MLPDRDDLAALYLLHKPFSAVTITLSDTLAVRATIPWVSHSSWVWWSQRPVFWKYRKTFRICANRTFSFRRLR